MGELANTSWAFSAREWAASRPLLDAIAAQPLAMIRDAGGNYPMQALATTAWACATLALHDEPLLEAIAAASLRRITQSPIDTPFAGDGTQKVRAVFWACWRSSISSSISVHQPCLGRCTLGQA